MQIDFLHAVTYVAARLAKFSVEDANVIGYSAQYVDDAVNSGTIRFRNKAMYSRISSAHKMLDYRNFKELSKIKENFLDFEDDEGEDRHRKWVDSIANGDFSFAEKGQEPLSYVHKGINSWKHEALDTKKEVETKNELFRFTPEFLDSDWKLFHDALQIHRIDIIRNILPKYGICVA